MKPRQKAAACVLCIMLFALGVGAQDWLDSLHQDLSIHSKNGFFRSDLSGLLDLEGYYVDQRPPALMFEDESFFNPRLSLFVDTQIGPHFYSLVQARLDRGFDPGEKNFEARLDEYLLRWTPWSDTRLNLQFGKSATVVGSWVQRHDSWQNPLITAPLPYENLTPISDDDIPTSAADFLARRHVPDSKDGWLPLIWGPVYDTGWTVFGNVGKFDYGVELKNAPLSSHPYSWELNSSLWRYPTFAGRLGFRPGPAWNMGLSFSAGPYLSPESSNDLPVGRKISDYDQVTFGGDIGYAWHRWQVWGEVFLSRFEVPNIGNADLTAYYVELKYKITARLFAAGRWNQELFGQVKDGLGGEQGWGNDMYRVDLAVGYRFTRHLQTKLQYSFGHRNSTFQQGEQLLAAQVTAKF